MAAIVYREVELFETPKSLGDSRRKVEDAGLKCVSGHFELNKYPARIESRTAEFLPFDLVHDSTLLALLSEVEGRAPREGVEGVRRETLRYTASPKLVRRIQVVI